MPSNIPKPPYSPEPPSVPRKTPKDIIKEFALGANKPAEDIPKSTKKSISKKTLGDIGKEFIFGADEPKEKYPLPHKKIEKESIGEKAPPPYMTKEGYVTTDKLRWEVRQNRFHKFHPTSPQKREELVKKWFGETPIVNPRTIEPLRKKMNTIRRSTPWGAGNKRKELESDQKLFDELFPPQKRR